MMLFLKALLVPAVSVFAAADGPAAPKPAAISEWKLLFTLDHGAAVTAVAAGKKEIAVAATYRPTLWSAETGKELATELRGGWYPDMPAGTLMRFDKDGNDLVLAVPYALKSTGRQTGCVTRYRRRPFAMVGASIDAFDVVGVSADLATVVVREADKPGNLFLYDGDLLGNPNLNLKNRTELVYPGGAAVTRVAVSGDGKRLAAAGDDSAVRVYDPATRKELHAIAVKKGVTVTAVALSDDGTRLAVGGGAGFAKVYDGAGAELCGLKAGTAAVAALTFSVDGKRVAVAVGRMARVFDAVTGAAAGGIAGHAGDVLAVAFSPDGSRLVTGSADKTAKVWQAKP